MINLTATKRKMPTCVRQASYSPSAWTWHAKGTCIIQNPVLCSFSFIRWPLVFAYGDAQREGLPIPRVHHVVACEVTSRHRKCSGRTNQTGWHWLSCWTASSFWFMLLSCCCVSCLSFHGHDGHKETAGRSYSNIEQWVTVRPDGDICIQFSQIDAVCLTRKLDIIIPVQ